VLGQLGHQFMVCVEAAPSQQIYSVQIAEEASCSTTTLCGHVVIKIIGGSHKKVDASVLKASIDSLDLLSSSKLHGQSSVSITSVLSQESLPVK
jgi:hypothetical protein